MSKVIDLVPRLKTLGSGPVVNHDSEPAQPGLLNFEEQKQILIFKERRQTRRTILSEFMSAMVVIPEKGLMKVQLHDISDDGVSFDLDPDQGAFKVGEEVAMRIYLNHKSYFPLQVTVKHITHERTEEQSEKTLRHGAEYVRGEASDVALQHLVRFVESISDGLKFDNGDFMIHRPS